MKIDEGAYDHATLLRAHELGCLDAVALKLSKFGGLSAMRRARDLSVFLGAEICAECVWACQDMLTIDIADGRGPRNQDGHLHLPEEPGLGVHPDESALGDPIALYQ